MTITERIFITLAQKNIAQKEFARAIEVNEKTVSAWKKNNSLPPVDKISNISDCLGVSVNFLLTGQESDVSTESLLADERSLLDTYKKLSPINKGRVIERAETLAEIEASEPPANKQTAQETLFIEYSVCSVSAGTGEPLIDDSQPDFIEVISSDLTEQANFAVKISGNSMLPRFKDNDIVLVKSQPTIEIGEVGIFIVDGCGYIKEYATDRLVSLNPEYDDIYFAEGQDIWCKGLVIGTLEAEILA